VELARLVGDRQWAVANRFGLGDIAVGTALDYLAVPFAEFNWAHFILTFQLSATGWNSARPPLVPGLCRKPLGMPWYRPAGDIGCLAAAA
jgi:hypothetical protein